jgi:hypothetical protein
MLRTVAPKNRFDHNSYFHFHPMHSAYSLVAALILLGLVAWFLLSAR